MKKRASGTTVSITLPLTPETLSMHALFDKISERVSQLIDMIRSKFTVRNRFTNTQENFHALQRNWKKKIPLVLLVVLSIGVIAFTIKLMMTSRSPVDARIVIKSAKASIPLNKTLSIPILDAKGHEMTKLSYIIESADLRDEIVVKGKRAVAVKGREFLILSIKMANGYEKALEVNARDYVRLAVNGKEGELLAPEIHNDPVTLQPISTKYTRLGFTINDTDKQLTLFMGEIKGEKEKVALGLR